MLGIGIHCPKDATLLGGANHTHHIKSQSLNIAYDEAIIIEWSIGQMGHIALSQYEMQFLPQKAVKGQAVADFLVEHPDPIMTKLYEDLPDEAAEVCFTQTYCNAPIPWVRGRHCDVHTQVRSTLTYIR